MIRIVVYLRISVHYSFDVNSKMSGIQLLKCLKDPSPLDVVHIGLGKLDYRCSKYPRKYYIRQTKQDIDVYNMLSVLAHNRIQTVKVASNGKRKERKRLNLS